MSSRVALTGRSSPITGECVTLCTSLSVLLHHILSCVFWTVRSTEWCNLDSILATGLLPSNPTECKTFNGDVYGRGVYVSPHQQYAKLYSRGTPRQVGAHGKVRLVFGLRLRNQAAISRTSDSRIWVIKNPADVVVQDINLTFD